MAAENSLEFMRDAAARVLASMRPRRMAAENGVCPDRGRNVQSEGFNEAAAHGRGKRPNDGLPLGIGVRFNEAAAHGRGKHHAVEGALFGGCVASMRPRRMAAENPPHNQRSSRCPSFNEAAAHGRGKRPAGAVEGRHGRASMRPRRMAAENDAPTHNHTGPDGASMRPRRMAAENADAGGACHARRRRFNEAAAHGRGKLDATGDAEIRAVRLQ